MPTNPIPTIIKIIAAILPNGVVGEISPYPTVVVVTKARKTHQCMERFLHMSKSLLK